MFHESKQLILSRLIISRTHHFVENNEPRHLILTDDAFLYPNTQGTQLRIVNSQPVFFLSLLYYHLILRKCNVLRVTCNASHVMAKSDRQHQNMMGDAKHFELQNS